MSTAKAPLTYPAPAAAPVAPELAPTRARAPAGPRPRPDGLSRNAGRTLAVAFAVAWILCPALEPTPADHVHYPLWQLPIDVAALGSLVAAVVVLWRGGRLGAPLGIAAGVMMAVETVVCPWAGHTPLGWWTWAQTGLSLFVLGTSALLTRGRAR